MLVFRMVNIEPYICWKVCTKHSKTSEYNCNSGMNLFEIDRVWMEELELRMIDEEMRGRAMVNPWDHEPGCMRWFYRVSHPIMCPKEALEEPPRPPNLEVVIEEQEARHDPNALEVCRNVSNELQRALDAGEAQEGTPIWHTVRRVLGMLNPCLTYRRLRRERRYQWGT
ncbi:hypothetical protein QL285_044525 [Trifolium repens]|nr:hypothetical protein QL285_044525 [Trifolium repens]